MDYGKKNDINEGKKEENNGELSTHKPYYGRRWEGLPGVDSSTNLKL